MNSASLSNAAATDALIENSNIHDQDLSIREITKRLDAVRAAKFQSIYIKDFEDNLASEEKLLIMLTAKQYHNQGWNNPLMVGFSKIAVVLVLILVVCFWGSFILEKLLASKNEALPSEPARDQSFQLSAKQILPSSS